MKLHLDCIPCFQRQALQAARFVTNEVNTHERILRKVVEELIALNWERSPPELARIVHGIVKQETGEYEPASPCSVGKTESWKKHRSNMETKS